MVATHAGAPEALFPIIIRLAGEPKGKGRPRFARATGRAYTPADTRRYEDALRYAAQEVMGERAPIEGPVFVTVSAALPVPSSWSGKKQRAALAGQIWPAGGRDVDNYLKSALDSLNKIVLRDDKQVVVCTVVKTYSARPELKIKVCEAVVSATVTDVVAPARERSLPPPVDAPLPAFFEGVLV